jgi:predicted metal-binding protein
MAIADYEKIAALAKECGFTNVAPLDVKTLEFRQDVRDMCNPDQCENYGKSWSCPPACASLEQMRETVLKFEGGILAQTVGELEDSYDWEAIMETGATQKKNFAKFWTALKEQYGDVFAMGTGVCRVCESCTYPDEPCRFPDKLETSMEACGLYVSKVCTDNGLKYNYGQDHIAFTSCFLIKQS